MKLNLSYGIILGINDWVNLNISLINAIIFYNTIDIFWFFSKIFERFRKRENWYKNKTLMWIK